MKITTITYRPRSYDHTSPNMTGTVSSVVMGTKGDPGGVWITDGRFIAAERIVTMVTR